ncbi:MAG: sugar phosphate isomerase/epimerase [Spirochaetia bacterium]|nr:sugar phosphate isomerase/epimerase [Spirochaetia bacterium]
MENNLKNLRFVPCYDGFLSGNKSASEIIDICKASGFYGIEGMAEYGIFNGSMAELTKIGEDFKKAGLSLDTFHLNWEHQELDDMSNLYECDRRRVVEKTKRWIEKAVACGSTIGIMHPCNRRRWNGLLCYDIAIEGEDRIYGQVQKSLQDLLKFCEQFNFKIAVENFVPYSGGMLGSRNEHMLRIYEDSKHPLLGFCLDTGHALMSFGKDVMSAYYAMEEHLIAFHLADNAGDRDSHILPGHGNFPWGDFFKALNKRGFTGNVCVETPPFDIGPNYSIEAWCKMFKELNELVEKSLEE